MRVLVTGGAGFIGANLCQRLTNTAGINDVIALDDLSTGFASNLSGIDVQFVEGSILDRSLLHDLLSGVDSVVHLAARPSVPRSVAEPVASHDANATGTLNVLEAARAHGGVHVVVASSSSVYGANPTLPKTEDLAVQPLSPYAASKLATESYAIAWQLTYGMPTLAFRFFNVYGPLQAAGHAYAAVIPAFVDAALAGRPLTIHGDGQQSRDFTYVDTVAEVLTEAVLRKVAATSPVNLAYGTRTDLLGVISLMEQQLGRPLSREHIDERAGDVRHSQAANDRLIRLFPQVRPIELEEGLAATMRWFESSAGTA